MKEVPIRIALFLLIGLSAIGITSNDTHFAPVSDLRARPAEQFASDRMVITTPNVADRMKAQKELSRQWIEKSCIPGRNFNQDECNLARESFKSYRKFWMM